MPTLKVTFPPIDQPQAQVQFEVNGVCGTGCTQFSASYEKKLGLVTDTQPTAEMYEQDANNSQSQEVVHGN